MSISRRTLWIAGGSAMAALLVVGYVAADATDVLPGPLTTEEPWPEASPFPTPTLPAQLAAAQVLPGWSDTAPIPTAAGLAPALDALRSAPEVGTPPGVLVVDVATGQVLAGAEGEVPRSPASTTKVLTGAAAVATLDLASRIPTTAVLGGSDEVYLVGAGDMALSAGAGDPNAVLGHAGLADLAEQVAAALTERGTSSVVLRVDDSAFERVSQARGWSAIDFTGGYVAPIQALGVDLGVIPGRTLRDTDPAMGAGTAFAQALSERGIEVREGPARAQAPADGLELARVESAPLGDLLDLAMAESSNTLTEVFGRLVAIESGQPANFDGATSAVLTAVANLGIDVSGTVLDDTCGLSSLNRVSPQVLTAVLVEAEGDPAMKALVTALPVAGLEGTLANRWIEAGLVRAKTGTLQGVVSLTGYAPTADGRLLAFAVMADGVPYAGAYAARVEVDEFVNSLLACGCR